MATSPIVDQVGSVLNDRYRLLAPIGTGASAHVYLADDVRLRRRVAVKMLHQGLAADDGFLRRFRAEAQAAAALRHPHIMSVFDWGESERGPYLVFEYLGGGSLRSLLDTGVRLDPSQTLLVGIEAAQALAHAHRRGLVHRDIKPANLLFDDEGRLAIADFGLARALAEAASTEPTGAVVGTARYAAPEQVKGTPVDDRSDVYALALTLVEAHTGSVPFAADTIVSTLMARVDRPLEVPDSLGPLRPILEAAGAPDPADRPDAAALARALDQAAGELPAPAALPLAGTPTIDLTAGDHDADLTALPGANQAGGGPYDQESDSTRSPGSATVETNAAGVVAIDAAPRRRWRRRLLGLLVALLVVGAGVAGAFAVAEYRVPRYDVPALRGLTVEAARAEVADEEFAIEVVRTEYDEDDPEGTILDQDPASGELKRGDTISVVVSRGPEPRDVPDLTGMDRPAVEEALAARGFAATFVEEHSEEIEKGRVIRWEPQGRQEKGTEVTVVLSAGPEPRPVPSLADRLLDPFRSLLERLGLRAKTVEVFSDDVAKGQIVRTEPAPGTAVPPGTEVTVFVSKGPDTVAVPNVANMTVDEASEQIERVGLKVEGVQGNPRRLVVGSDPKAGTEVKRGTGVTLITR